MPSNRPHPAPPIRTAALSKAELVDRLDTLPCAPSHVLEACPAEKLTQELGSYRVELEAQNLALRESQQKTEEARDRYSDLYDFAPVGYVTLNRQGCVEEINLTGAAMLGSERKDVLGKPLLMWLQAESHVVFLQHLRRVLGSNEHVVDTVLLHNDSGPPWHINLVSSVVAHGRPDERQACRTALIDITPLKEKETELTQSRLQLQELSAHLDRVREYERRHLAREIHDELGQKLTTLRFEVAMLSAELGSPALDLPRTAASLLRQIDDSIDSVRAIASDLRPAVLDLGLAAAVEWQIQELRRRTGMACNLMISGEEIAMDNDHATAVFRIVQESLTNIIRHAGASQIELNLSYRDDALHILVLDNGVGMAPDALQKSRSFGIAGMRERVRLLAGTLKISSSPGHGTRLKIVIPLAQRLEQNDSSHDHEDVGSNSTAPRRGEKS